MKTISFKWIRIGRFSIAAISILLLMYVLLLHVLTPFLIEQLPRLEMVLSQKLRVPVHIKKMQVYWRGISPVFDLQQVSLGRVNLTPFLSVKEASVEINGWQSLWHHAWRLRSISLHGMRLSLIQKSDDRWQIEGMASFSGESQSSNIAQLFLTLSRWQNIELQDVMVDAQTKSKMHGQFVIQEADWKSQIFSSDRFHLKLQIKQPLTTTMVLSGRISGNLLQPDQCKIALSDVFTSMDLAVLSPYLAWDDLTLVQGKISGKISATWQKEWQKIHFQNTLEGWQLQSSSPPFFLKNAIIDLVWRSLAPHQWALTGNISTLSWARWKNIPGVAHMAGHLTLSPDKGDFFVNSQGVILDFGDLFAKPLALDRLTGNVAWERKAQGWIIQARQWSAKNADIASTGSMAVFWQSQKSPWLSIKARYLLASSVIKHLKNYLPLTVLHPSLVDWLTQSLQHLDQAQGTFQLQGIVKNFPYVVEPGIFWAESQIRGAALAYLPGWPRAKNVNGELVFNRNTMQMHVTSADLMNVPIQETEIDIPALGKDSVLSLQGNVLTDADRFLQFIQQSPLKERIGNQLSNLRWEGPLQLHLKLALPLAVKSMPPRVDGVIFSQSTTLRLPDWQMALEGLQGTLRFTQKDLVGENLTAKLWGSPLILNIKKPFIQFQGHLVLDQLPASFLEVIKPYMTGSCAYQGRIQGAKNDEKETQITLMSDMQGVKVQLPGSLSKSAESQKKLQIKIILLREKLRYELLYDKLRLILLPFKTGWQAEVTYPQIAGQLFWSRNEIQQTIEGQLQRLYLKSSALHPQEKIDPAKIPALALSIKDMQYNDKKLGFIHLKAEHERHGLRITQFNNIEQNYQLNAQGRWIKIANKPDFTQIKGTLSSSDLSKTLSLWGLPASLQGGKGNSIFDLQWQGPVYAPHLATLRGILHLHLMKGQIQTNSSEAKMDIGRLLTFLSFQSLERRLQLDFSDLTHTGLTFDTIQGDFQLSRGVATINNGFLDGPVAEITMQGEVDLVHETYDLHLVVMPHITSSLPVVAAIAGGPILGAATWIANKVINPVLNKLASDSYSVTGRWQKPLITPI